MCSGWLGLQEKPIRLHNPSFAKINIKPKRFKEDTSLNPRK